MEVDAVERVVADAGAVAVAGGGGRGVAQAVQVRRVPDLEQVGDPQVWGKWKKEKKRDLGVRGEEVCCNRGELDKSPFSSKIKQEKIENRLQSLYKVFNKELFKRIKTLFISEKMCCLMFERCSIFRFTL